MPEGLMFVGSGFEDLEAVTNMDAAQLREYGAVTLVEPVVIGSKMISCRGPWKMEFPITPCNGPHRELPSWVVLVRWKLPLPMHSFVTVGPVTIVLFLQFLSVSFTEESK